MFGTTQTNNTVLTDVLSWKVGAKETTDTCLAHLHAISVVLQAQVHECGCSMLLCAGGSQEERGRGEVWGEKRRETQRREEERGGQSGRRKAVDREQTVPDLPSNLTAGRCSKQVAGIPPADFAHCTPATTAAAE